MSENNLAFIYKVDTSTGYTVHTWRLYSQGEVKPLQEILLGTVDNRDGYGSEDACRRIATQCEAYLQQGYTHAFYAGWNCCHIELRIQHYQKVGDKDLWCMPRWEQWASDLSDWEKNLKFARSLRIPHHDDTGPDVVFKRLLARNAIRLIPGLQLGCWLLVDTGKAQHRKVG